MNTQNLSTLQVFQSLCRKCKSHFIRSCPKEFIRFLCECIVNLLKKKFARHKKKSRGKVLRRSFVTIVKKTTWKQRRNILSSENDCNYLTVITPPVSLIFCLDMEQFVLVPAAVYSQSVTTQSVTKQELPKYEAEQPPTYQIDSLKRDINKKMFGKADSLIDKILSCSRIKLSNSQTKVSDGVDTGVLISVFTQHLRRKSAEIPDIYFTLLDAAGISLSLVFNLEANA